MDEDNPLTFPDQPRVELDRVLGDLVDRAHDVIASQEEARAELERAIGELVRRAHEVTTTQGRLRALLRANIAIVQELDLPMLLQRIVDAAVELIGAQYAALGVIGTHGGLDQFIHVGMSEVDVEVIGHLPEGRGLLGALIDDPSPIRLAHLSEDPRSSGFPAGHPPMESFLGVPIRVRDEVYGNLYLSNRSTGEFTAEDEQLAIALAATAGFAIDNARLLKETQTRQAWSAASAEITTTLLAEEQADPLSVLVSRVRVLSAADYACVLEPGAEADDLEILAANGVGGRESVGETVPRVGSIAGSVLEAMQPRIIADSEDRIGSSVAKTFGPLMAIPLLFSDTPVGVLLIARAKMASPFTSAELDMVADFVGHAIVAIELAQARLDRQRALLLEDRARIARDLHDHVIQKLFATGLGLQSIAGRLPGGPDADRLEHSIDDLDGAIAQIRTAIFAISGARLSQGGAVRHAVLDIVNELRDGFGHTPQIEFSGPVDLTITDELAGDVIAVVRESLTNVAKHADAKDVTIRIGVDQDSVSVDVDDDGIGIPDDARSSGLANLQERAVRLGGSFSAATRDGRTRVRWTVPRRFPLEGSK